jgi:membrane protein required for colicin V production
MNSVDIVAAVIVLACGLRVLVRGFIKEVLSVAAPLVAGLAAFLFWKPLAALGLRLWPALPMAGAIAAGICFLVCFLAMKILEHALSSAIEALRLGLVDRLLGFLVGALEGLLICALLAAILRYQPIWDARPLLEGSLFWRLLSPFLPAFGEA